MRKFTYTTPYNYEDKTAKFIGAHQYDHRYELSIPDDVFIETLHKCYTESTLTLTAENLATVSLLFSVMSANESANGSGFLSHLYASIVAILPYNLGISLADLFNYELWSPFDDDRNSTVDGDA